MLLTPICEAVAQHTEWGRGKKGKGAELAKCLGINGPGECPHPHAGIQRLWFVTPWLTHRQLLTGYTISSARWARNHSSQYTQGDPQVLILSNCSITCAQLDLTKTRNTFCGTWYLPHSHVHNERTVPIIMAGCMAHEQEGYISTSGLKSDLTAVFLGPDFLYDAGVSAIRPK